MWHKTRQLDKNRAIVVQRNKVQNDLVALAELVRTAVSAGQMRLC